MATAVPPGRVVRAGLLSLAVLASVTAAGAADGGAERALAQQILEAAGFQGGLIVHIGCGDGTLTAALRARESYLVHGLSADAGAVRQAREYIQKRGAYGPVSVERFDGKRLPYVDNLASLVVAERLGDVPMEEAMRVLAPGGTAYVKRGGPWTKAVKPRPGNTDEWTHFLHDASGNAVAHDAVVGPPRRVQWIALPRHTRSHEHTPSIFAVVSTGGRIFYVADEAPVVSLRRLPQWRLVARDAYSGVLLWKRPVATWFSHLCGWTQQPPQLQRKLVAVGDRVYITLGYHAPLSAVDAATGRTLKVYEQTHGTEEVLCHKGLLLLAVRTVTDDRVAEFDRWAQLAKQEKSPLHARETVLPLIKRFRGIEAKAKRTLLALDAESGRVLWKRAGADVAGLRPLSLCAVGDQVFYQKGRDVVCRDLKTGRERWAVPSSRLRVVSDGRAICASGETVTALSAETGKTLWTQPAKLCQIRDAFVINGSLWLGGFRPYDTGRKHTGPPWGPYFATQRDLATGKILKLVEPEGPGHHHRCWQNKATDRYIIAGRRGAEFIDLQSGDVLWHSWVRGVCRYGVMPCNGLLYAPPHACGCYIAAKLDGFHALASGPAKAMADEPAPPQLETGPAHGAPEPRAAKLDTPSDWPTYRHDAQRSGCSSSVVPAQLRRAWQVTGGDQLTSPTVAGGRVFVASVDEHRLCALDAESGRPAWRFTAGARVDSPPTLHKGRAIFGCRDGCVYSVRAADGVLAWRLRAARDERRIAACGQLESPSPVPGSVLVQGDAAYFSAGRSSYLDGGITLYRVQPETGKTLSRTPIYSPDPETGKQPKHYGPCNMPGALADILSGDERCVYLRDMVFDKRGGLQAKGNPHLFTLTGFLDDTWPHRSYWIFGTRCSLSTGCSGRDRNLVYGRLLVFDASSVYGFGRASIHWSNHLQDAAYRLFALGRDERKQRWTKRVPILARAMVLAGKVLFVAGPPAAAVDAPEVPDENPGGVLLALATADGAELGRYRLDAPPVFDGMAAAGGRLYLALEDGHVVCMGGEGGR